MNCKNGTLNNLQKSIISTLVISLMLFNRAYSLSTCQCQQVDSAQELRDLIYSQRNDDGISQDHLLLCPFDLATSPIAIDFPIHIQCYKENLNHQCILRPKYNQQSSILKIESDNVWLEGINVKFAKDIAVMVSEGSRNTKLINMVFSFAELPDNTISHAIIKAGNYSSCQIIKSTFYRNVGTAIRNFGEMIIISSTFKNNEGAKKSANEISRNRGTIVNKKQLVLSGNTFMDNQGDLGSVVFSTLDAHTYDAGGNCGNGNEHCNGVENMTSVYPEPFNTYCHEFDDCGTQS